MSQELNTSEKFLETSIIVERFFKRYKKQIIAVVVVAIGAAVGYGVYEYRKNTNLIASNMAYLKLTKNPQDTSSLAILKDTNPRLYDVFVSIQAIGKNETINANTNDPILSDLVKYYNAKDAKSLSSYTLEQKALLKNMAILEEAYKLFENGEKDKAKQVLQNIPFDSSLKQVADSLSHYGVTK